MRLSEIDSFRSTIETSHGPASYVDVGTGGAVLFLHGVGTSSYLWRNAIDLLRHERRCVAVDLPVHGHTPSTSGQDLSLTGLAAFIEGFCEALPLTEIDLVANDTGGAVAQILAAKQPRRLRSFTLTNCDTQDDLPPKSFLPIIIAAKMRLLAPLSRLLFGNLERARRAVYGPGYQDVSALPLDVVEAQLSPLFASKAGSREYQRLIRSLDAEDLRAVESLLRDLRVPTQMIWGTGDRFFDIRWAYWLRDLIPGATEVHELSGARLFFPDERADDLVALLRAHWATIGEATQPQESRP